MAPSFITNILQHQQYVCIHEIMQGILGGHLE